MPELSPALVTVFDATVSDTDADILSTRLQYKELGRWDTRMYERLLDADKHNVALIRNLTFELTRAANYVCDRVRESLDPRFRLAEGALMLTGGPHNAPSRRPEYRAGARVLRPYPGLPAFQRIGPKRDFWTHARDV